MNVQDEKYLQKLKSISSAEPNYFVHLAMRYPVIRGYSLINLSTSIDSASTPVLCPIPEPPPTIFFPQSEKQKINQKQPAQDILQEYISSKELSIKDVQEMFIIDETTRRDTVYLIFYSNVEINYKILSTWMTSKFRKFMSSKVEEK